MPWAEMRIKEAQVSKLLSRYPIGPGTVWPKGRRTNKTKGYRGYMRSWFVNAWKGYLQEEK
jgi:hypothetical protein